jgi:hypothetical protein
MIFDHRLHFAPINTRGKILDIACGTGRFVHMHETRAQHLLTDLGIWAMEMGDKYPDADVRPLSRCREYD